MNMQISKIFNGKELNSFGHIIKTKKDDFTMDSIHCREITGHEFDIYCNRIGDIEITIYRDPLDVTNFGSEIYYYKSESYDIKYSRNYKRFDKFPEKYEDRLEEIKKKFNEAFSHIERYKNYQLA